MATFSDPHQAEAWNGYEGTHWATNADRWNAINAGVTEPLLTAAAIGPSDRVLDIGCGAGQTTRLAARRGASAFGIDLSEPMLATARATAAREGVDNVTFEQGDAQLWPFEPATFDVAISRYGVMFFPDPVAAFANVRRALSPGGRLAFVCPTDPAGNDWVSATMSALRDILPPTDFGTPNQPGMFAFSDADRVHEVLAGYADVRLDRIEAFGEWGSSAEDAADFLLTTGPGRHLTASLDESANAKVRDVLVTTMREHERSDGRVALRATAWLVTARNPE